MNRKIILAALSIVVLLFIILFVLNNSKEEALLAEHCSMLPGGEGCDKYLDSYKEKGRIFTRTTDNLPSKQESALYEPKKGIMQLVVEPVKMNIRGKEIRMYGYNGQIPGPRIQVNQGDTIFVNVTNKLDMETTVHWHGLRLKNEFDGVPYLTQAPIKIGESFLYELNFPDAGIYWYHPHVREDYQQELGLYGNIFVVPINKSYYNIVNREEFIFLDDLQLNDREVTPTYDSKISQVLMGRFGNIMFINGKESYNLTVNTRDVVRFFLTDSSNTRLFNFSIESTRLKIIGSDGGSFNGARAYSSRES